MLVLSRKVDQQILIGNNIVVTILRVKGRETVSIGIEAPDDVRIVRTEIAHLPSQAAASAQHSPLPQTTTCQPTAAAPRMPRRPVHAARVAPEQQIRGRPYRVGRTGRPPTVAGPTRGRSASARPVAV